MGNDLEKLKTHLRHFMNPAIDRNCGAKCYFNVKSSSFAVDIKTFQISVIFFRHFITSVQMLVCSKVDSPVSCIMSHYQQASFPTISLWMLSKYLIKIQFCDKSFGGGAQGGSG